MHRSHICSGCGTDLSGLRAPPDPHYGLPIVVCPACSMAVVRRPWLGRASKQTRLRFSGALRAMAFRVFVVGAPLLLLGLGGTSMQAIAIFIDLEGNDRYSSAGQNTLGQSGGDSYHYQRDTVFSFSAFFDLGGGYDTYPPSGANTRTNNSVISTGQRNEQNPANSTHYGIFVDQ